MELERRGLTKILLKNLDEEAVCNVNDIVNIEPGCHREKHLKGTSSSRGMHISI